MVPKHLRDAYRSIRIVQTLFSAEALWYMLTPFGTAFNAPGSRGQVRDGLMCNAQGPAVTGTPVQRANAAAATQRVEFHPAREEWLLTFRLTPQQSRKICGRRLWLVKLWSPSAQIHV